MGVTKEGKTNGAATDRPRCEVTDVRGGISYRCAKHAGHELSIDRRDHEHEVVADEYCHRPPDWRAMFLEALPMLEWAAEHPDAVGALKSDQSRRLLVRHYLAATHRPGLAKAS